MKKNFTQNSKLGKLDTGRPVPSGPSGAGNVSKETKTLAVKLDASLIDKLNDYVFWTPQNQSEVVEQILSDFLDGQRIEPIPSHIKEQQERAKLRRQAGRKK